MPYFHSSDPLTVEQISSALGRMGMTDIVGSGFGNGGRYAGTVSFIHPNSGKAPFQSDIVNPVRLVCDLAGAGGAIVVCEQHGAAVLRMLRDLGSYFGGTCGTDGTDGIEVHRVRSSASPLGGVVAKDVYDSGGMDAAELAVLRSILSRKSCLDALIASVVRNTESKS